MYYTHAHLSGEGRCVSTIYIRGNHLLYVQFLLTLRVTRLDGCLPATTGLSLYNVKCTVYITFDSKLRLRLTPHLRIRHQFFPPHRLFYKTPISRKNFFYRNPLWLIFLAVLIFLSPMKQVGFCNHNNS